MSDRPRFICDFCGDDERTAKRIYAGHTANICLACVLAVLAVEIGQYAPESSALLYQAGHMPGRVTG